MIGAIAGDIIGSVYESYPTQDDNFPLFQPYSHLTDDSILTLATVDCLLNQGDYTHIYHQYYHRFPNAGYGKAYSKWAATSQKHPYNSWGNGSAMRVSPIGWAFDNLEDTLIEATRSSSVTHNHPSAIKGAQSVAAAIYLARTEKNKPVIKKYLQWQFDYDLSPSFHAIRQNYEFDVSADGSIPQAIIAFLESTDYESAVRNAVLLGGDADTQPCIAGSIAEAFYGSVPSNIRNSVFKRLSSDFSELLMQFYQKYQIRQ